MWKKKRQIMLIPIYATILCAVLTIALLGSKSVSVFVENSPVNGRKCVIIDAGHGGIDGGAISCSGATESTINLQIALRLDDLMHLIGIHTVMIRTTDESMHTQGQTIAAKKISDLKQRVNIVNNTANAILVSIHQNHFTDSRYSGAQIFYSGTEESDVLAQSLQSLFVHTLNPGSKRSAKKATGIYLMRNIQCTAVLVECGFLSNPAEEVKLRSEDYQKKICCVLAAGVSSYLHGKPIA